MADIQPVPSGKGRRKLSTPRIDLTPMVDLGFLLITFFMYTTALARPKVMELQMPYNTPKVPPSPIPAEATLVLMPTSGHRVAFYPGTHSLSEKLQWRTFTGALSIRSLIQDEAIRGAILPKSFSAEAHKLHLVIKPDTGAAYEDVVHCLDEMAISDVSYYAIMRISANEQSAIRKFLPPVYGK